MTAANDPPAATRDAAPPAPPLTADVEVFVAAASAKGALLAIDLGTKTLGLATSDASRMIATPLETLPRTKFRADTERLAAIIAERAITAIVIGLPTNLDGSSGPRVQATRAYARNLTAALSLPILLWDERWTTLEAERMLIAADTSRRRRADVIDKLAATLILQGALDRLRALQSG